ncbi:hypothetical protein BUALT_Bualt07G0057600 [Buddleja alternifolia]|uniref:DUF659 domain-containing protein n=1 Tax=Buddleja alternifolia TaxID=168488 RepID=A0AAV6XG82_9LAMI|nr:hypothetical protein BUALT_Bualt07G0057600 [Buddleja alternifolia]
MNFGSSSQSGGDVSSPPSDNRPLWKYVTKMTRSKECGGNIPFTCNLCKATYKGSYSRVKSHLLKIGGNGIKVCSKVTDSQLNEMKKLEDEATQRREIEQPRLAPLSGAFSSSSQSSSHSVSVDALNSMRQEGYEYAPRKRKVDGDNNPIEKAFNYMGREQLDAEIAKMFYSAGLPFNLARNPHYVKAFSYATNSRIAGYVPPGYNALRTTLLANERRRVESSLEFTKSTWNSTSVTLVCDGWSDPQRRPLINFMAISENGTMFIHAINCEGEYKDKWFIARLIKEVIVEVGVTNVVQVITDNAPVCKAAGLLIEQAYPRIFWTPCVVHTLNLALKNICAAKNTDANEITYDECHWITEIATSAVMIKNFISNHSMRLAMFNEFSKLKLLAVAETRFASVIIMLKRFKLIKQQLQVMVISERWSCYRDDDFNKARIVKERLLDDLWWDSIDYILAFTDPIYNMLRECDTDKSCLHLVYEMWDSMIYQVRSTIYKHEKKSDNEDSSFWNVVRKVLEDRWSKSNTPLHCLAYSLNPRSTSKRLVPDEDARRKVNIELANFLGCLEDFGDGDCDTKMWDVGGDAFESSDDVGILEIANLSLDEPGLENDLFVDEVGEAPCNDSEIFPNVED